MAVLPAGMSAVAQQSQPAGGARPTLVPPLVRTYERTFSSAMTLLGPAAGGLGVTDWRNYFVYADGAVYAYQAATNEAVWPAPAPCAMPPRLLLVTNDRVVLATRYQVIGLSARTGARIWTVAEQPLGWSEVRADPENFPTLRHYAVLPDRVVSFRDDGWTECVAVVDGARLWSRSLPHRLVTPPAIDPEFLVYVAQQATERMLVVLSANQGTTCQVRPLANDGQVDRILLGPQHTATILTAQGGQGFDATDGRLLWTTKTDRRPVAASVAAGEDGLYLSWDGLTLSKLDWLDGRIQWSSPPAVPLGGDLRHVFVGDGRVYVISGGALTILDACDGRVLRAMAAPADAQLNQAVLAAERLVLVATSPRGSSAAATAMFLDDLAPYAASEPPVRQSLGRVTDLRAVLFCDGALLVQDGPSIIGWTKPQGSAPGVSGSRTTDRPSTPGRAAP
jgi:outer membrane protein assembly factor BamB